MKSSQLILLYFLLLLLPNAAIHAQQWEAAAGVPFNRNFYFLAERSWLTKNNYTTVVSIAHKLPAFMDLRFGQLLFGNTIDNPKVRRTKIDFGIRRYRFDVGQPKAVNPYVGISVGGGTMSRAFMPYGLKIPADSLRQSSAYLTAEGTTGLKMTFLGNLTLTTSLGLIYSQRLQYPSNLSTREELWYHRDFFDGEIISKKNPYQRRERFINWGFGFMPNIYVNFGYRF